MSKNDPQYLMVSKRDFYGFVVTILCTVITALGAIGAALASSYGQPSKDQISLLVRWAEVERQRINRVESEVSQWKYIVRRYHPEENTTKIGGDEAYKKWRQENPWNESYASGENRE